MKSIYRIQKFGYAKPPAKEKKKEFFKKGLRNIFGKYLLLTNIISSGILMCAGDLIQQEIERFKEGKQKIDWERNRKLKFFFCLKQFKMAS